MENRYYNSYLFLRRYFNIPKCRSLRWCIIQETTQNGVVYKLGAKIGRSDKYIDVAERRIFSELSAGIVKRETMEASRLSEGKNFIFVAENGRRLVKPKNYLTDIYFTSWWSEDLAEARLY